LPSDEALQAELLSRFEQLTWVGVEIKGTKARIRVVEGKRPEQRPLANPRHLVASKSGIVKEIFVEQGTARVTRNQRVKKGQILIAGYMGHVANRRVVSAKGSVKGLVWYEVSATVPLVQEQRKLSGESFKKTSLLIGSRIVSLGSAGPSFRQYKAEESVRLWRVGRWILPIGIHEKTYYETRAERRTLSRSEALALAKERARHDLLRQLDKHAEIVMEKVLQETVVSGTLKVKLHYEVLEEIAQELPILPGEEQQQEQPQESA
jgi:similar to stage IV sporulation protein